MANKTAKKIVTKRSTPPLPAAAGNIARAHPTVWKAYAALGEACTKAGPLDGRTARLAKVALAIGLQSEGAVHSHTRRAHAEGLAPEELRHIALLAIPTIGFPRAMAALSWIDDILEGRVR